MERLIPLLIRLLDPVSPHHRPIEPTDPGIQIAVFDTSTFVLTMEALEEVMSKCALSDSMSAKSLTQPLLAWCYLWGGKLLQITTEGQTTPSPPGPDLNVSQARMTICRVHFASSLLPSGTIPPASSPSTLSPHELSPPI
jgi:hypothetical protein